MITKRRSNSNMFYAIYKLTPKVGIHEVKIYRRTCFSCYATRTFPNLFDIIHSSLSVAWLGLLVAGLSLRRPAFVSGSVHMGFLFYKVALGQVFTRILWFPLSVSFHRGSPYSYIIWEVNNKPDGGHSSETRTWTIRTSLWLKTGRLGFGYRGQNSSLHHQTHISSDVHPASYSLGSGVNIEVASIRLYGGA
jgi:hypothetical protein